MNAGAKFGEGPWLTRRRDALEEQHPPDVDPGLVRRFVPGPWVYELSHSDGRIELLTEDEYQIMMDLFRDF